MKMAPWGRFKVPDVCSFTELPGLSLLASLPWSSYDAKVAIW